MSRRPECPMCGSTDTVCKRMGRDVTDCYTLRQRNCRGCHKTFTTAEVPLLDSDGEPVPFMQLDMEWRDYHRNYARSVRGYQGKTYQRRTKPMARIDVEVRVRRAPRAA